jgi:hypothetical protein
LRPQLRLERYLSLPLVSPRAAVSVQPIVPTGVYNGMSGLVASGSESFGCLDLYDQGQSTADTLAA